MWYSVGPGILLELPAEERAPELTGLRGVARGKLDVNHLACHVLLLSSSFRRWPRPIIH